MGAPVTAGGAAGWPVSGVGARFPYWAAIIANAPIAAPAMGREAAADISPRGAGTDGAAAAAAAFGAAAEPRVAAAESAEAAAAPGGAVGDVRAGLLRAAGSDLPRGAGAATPERVPRSSSTLGFGTSRSGGISNRCSLR
ncbi:hypothetical protein GCM10027089_58980 [Nocardia thraciensis]